MGDIVDMMLEGALCSGCGVYLPGPSCGVPRLCRDCRPTKAERKAANIARHEAEQARQQKTTCPICGKRVRLVGLLDHQRDAHPAPLPPPQDRAHGAKGESK